MLRLLRLLLLFSAAGSTALTAAPAATVTPSSVAAVVESSTTSTTSSATTLVLPAVSVRLLLVLSASISAWPVALVSGPGASALLVAAGVRRGR
jgi:hypothetical protein